MAARKELLVYLLRHGETAWNAAGNRYCGRTDIDLSESGRRQAERTAGALENIAFKAVFCSTLRRSLETGSILLNNRNESSMQIQTDERLLELDFGRWEGKTAAEIRQSDPELWQRWVEDPEQVRAGVTGETAREVFDRLERFFLEAHTKYAGHSILVVGHNTANRIYIAGSAGAPLRSYRSFIQNNAGISVFSKDSITVRWIQINDVHHL